MIIRFGSDKLTTIGRNPDYKKGELSQCEGEKVILLNLLEQAINIFNTMKDAVVIHKAIQKINEATNCVDLTEQEIERIIRTYEMLKERPVKWAYYGNLFQQLMDTNTEPLELHN